MVSPSSGFIQAEYGRINGFDGENTWFTLHDDKDTICSYNKDLSKQGFKLRDKVVLSYTESRQGGLLILSVTSISNVKFGRGFIESKDAIRSHNGVQINFAVENVFIRTLVRYDSAKDEPFKIGDIVTYEAVKKEKNTYHPLHDTYLALRVFLNRDIEETDEETDIPTCSTAWLPNSQSSVDSQNYDSTTPTQSIIKPQPSCDLLFFPNSSDQPFLSAQSLPANITLTSAEDLSLDKIVKDCDGIVIERFDEYCYLWSKDIGRVMYDRPQIQKDDVEVAKWVRFNAKRKDETSDLVSWWAEDVCKISPKMHFSRGDWDAKFEIKNCDGIVMTMYETWGIVWNDRIGRIVIEKETLGEKQWNKCNIRPFVCVKLRATVIDKNDKFFHRDLCWKATQVEPWSSDDDDEEEERPQFPSLRACYAKFTLTSTYSGFWKLQHPELGHFAVTWTDFSQFYNSAYDLYEHLSLFENFEIIYVPIMKQYETDEVKWRAIYLQPHVKGQLSLQQMGFISANNVIDTCTEDNVPPFKERNHSIDLIDFEDHIDNTQSTLSSTGVPSDPQSPTTPPCVPQFVQELELPIDQSRHYSDESVTTVTSELFETETPIPRRFIGLGRGKGIIVKESSNGRYRLKYMPM